MIISQMKSHRTVAGSLQMLYVRRRSEKAQLLTAERVIVNVAWIHLSLTCIANTVTCSDVDHRKVKEENYDSRWTYWSMLYTTFHERQK